VVRKNGGRMAPGPTSFPIIQKSPSDGKASSLWSATACREIRPDNVTETGPSVPTLVVSSSQVAK
ncbi:hypothetical protein KI387_027665, partial [Taxus chinensis]